MTAVLWRRLDVPGHDGAGAQSFDVAGVKPKSRSRQCSSPGTACPSSSHVSARSIVTQRYERRTETTYWYESRAAGYAAELVLADDGFTRSYPGLWEREGP